MHTRLATTKTHSFMRRYGVALLSVAITALLTLPLGRLHYPNIFPLFLVAVIVSAWSGGLGPGLLATGLAAVVSFLFHTDILLSTGTYSIEWLILFVLASFLISWLDAARQQTGEALRESEDRYRDLVEHSHDLICTHDLEGRLLSVNHAASRLLGYDREALLGRNIREVLLPKFRHQFEQYIAELQQHGIARGLMFVQTRTGEQRIWEYNNTLRTEGVTVPIVRGMSRDVTEQQRAERALKASEAELRALFAAMTDVFFVLDVEGRYLKIAPTSYVYSYTPPEELIGKTLSEVFPPEKAEFFLAQIGRTLNEGRLLRVEYSLRFGEKEVWFDASISPLSKEAVVWIARDITERKLVEQKLDERLRFETLLTELSAAFANLPSSQVETEIDRWLQYLVEFLRIDRATFLHFSEDGMTLHRSHSYTVPGVEPLTNIPINDHFPWMTEQIRQGQTMIWSRIPDDIPEAAIKERAYAAKLGVKSGLNLPISIGGAVVCTLSFTSVRAYRDWPDELVARLRLVGEIFANTFARNRAEKSSKLFRSLLDQSSDTVEIIDESTLRFLDCNESAYQTLGYTREEFLSLTVRDIDPTINPLRFAQLDEEMKKSGFVTFESLHLRKDGTMFPVEVNVKVVRLEKDYRLAVVRDITERKQAEQSLKQSEREYRGLFEAAHDAIIIFDPEEEIVLEANQRACEMYGFSRAEFIGMSLKAISQDVERGNLRVVETLERGTFYNFETTQYRSDGTEMFLDINASVVEYKGQRAIQSINRDITKRKRAEEILQTFPRRLIEAQEAERRRVARELHDEIGQALTAIKLNLQNARFAADVAPHLDESSATIDRALQQVRDLSFDLRPSLLDDLGLIAALRWHLDREAQRAGLISEFVADLLATRLPPELETACFRIAQEALTNVVRHAQAKGVSIQLRRREAELHLVIQDDGIGFNARALGNGRASEKNLGVQGMQERALILGGNLAIKSAPERGTEIHAWFPLRSFTCEKEQSDL